jgi:hypothetical protein
MLFEVVIAVHLGSLTKSEIHFDKVLSILFVSKVWSILIFNKAWNILTIDKPEVS